MRPKTPQKPRKPSQRPRGGCAWAILALAAVAAVGATASAAAAVPVCHYADRVDLGGRRHTMTVYAYPKYYRDAANAWQPTRERFRRDGTEWVADQGVHRLSVRADGRAIATHCGHALTFQLRGLTTLEGNAIAGKRLADIDLAAWTLDTSAAERGALTWRHADGSTYTIRYVADQVRDEFVISDARRAAIKAAMPGNAERWGLDFDLSLPPGLTRRVAGKQEADHDTGKPIEMRGEGCRQRLVPGWVPDPRDATGRAGWRERWRIAGGRMVQSVPVDAIDHARSLRTTVSYQEGVDAYAGTTQMGMISNSGGWHYSGGDRSINAGFRAAGVIDHMLLKFDTLVSGPITVTTATFQLQKTGGSFTNPGDGTFQLCQMLKTWADRGSSAWEPVGYPNWNMNVYNTVSWGTVGASGDGVDRDLTVLATTTVTTSNQAYTWQSEALDSLVEGWANGTTSNYGVQLKAATETGVIYKTATFAGYADATTAYRPKLTIVYTEGGGANPAAAWMHFQRMRR